MTVELRVVFDVNVHVSAGLFPGTVPERAIATATVHGQVVISPSLLDELTDVLQRPRFDRYLPYTDRMKLIDDLRRFGELVVPTTIIRLCRDPDDDKLLELAVDGRASHLVTGDQDLLALHPFQTIPILTPADFLTAVGP